MSAVFLRVDDRLVHGQVVEGWLPHLRAEAVLVASEQAARDEVSRALMRMALPSSVSLEVAPARRAAEVLSSPAFAGKRCLVLAPGPSEALEVLRAGVEVDRVNIGGLHHSAGKIRLGRAVFLDEADRAALRDIAARGLRLEGRALPGDPPEDLGAALGGP